MGDGAAAWISLAALIVSLLVAAISVLRRSPFVPAGVADELRSEIKELTRRNSEFHRENESLCQQLDAEIHRSRFWQKQFELLKNGKPG